MAKRAQRRGMLGLFREPDEVADAMDRLRAAGFPGDRLTVLSGTPYPEGAFGEERVRHKLYVFPFSGAACGIVVGLLLTIGTQLSYPLVTGGKPILSIPPMINVMYEGTMLGAIVFSVLGIIFESRLPELRDMPYDARISEGYLGVAVAGIDGREDAVARALQEAGAVDVVR
jgi:molybdopterin-containing oxidoreductase family membrane subunit